MWYLLNKWKGGDVDICTGVLGIFRGGEREGGGIGLVVKVLTGLGKGGKSEIGSSSFISLTKPFALGGRKAKIGGVREVVVLRHRVRAIFLVLVLLLMIGVAAPVIGFIFVVWRMYAH